MVAAEATECDHVFRGNYGKRAQKPQSSLYGAKLVSRYIVPFSLESWFFSSSHVDANGDKKKVCRRQRSYFPGKAVWGIERESTE